MNKTFLRDWTAHRAARLLTGLPFSILALRLVGVELQMTNGWISIVALVIMSALVLVLRSRVGYPPDARPR